jgi:hypothetical protein
LVCRILILIAPVFYFFVLLVLTLIAINHYLDIIRFEQRHADLKQFV